MPLEARGSDIFTRDNLLLGFSTVEFTPRIAGVLGTPVNLGLLSAQEMAKEVNLLTLPDGRAGTVSVNRELLSSLEPSFNLSTFNFEKATAQYIFGASSLTDVVADAASAVTDEGVTVPAGSLASSTFANLVNGEIDDTAGNLTLTCAPIVDEAVGTGDGTSGDASGDFALDFKPALIGEVTAVTVAGVTYDPIAVAAAAAGLEVEIVVGVGATSGDMQFFSGGAAVNVTGAILATYTPVPALEEDFAATSPDMLLDPLLGRIRFPLIDSAASKDGTSLIRQGQNLLLDYLYSRKAHTTLQPFTQGGGVFEGAASIKHLTDVGINFIWDVPAASIRIDDNALTFGSDDFAVGTIVLNILDAGGSSRYGTMQLATETQSGA